MFKIQLGSLIVTQVIVNIFEIVWNQKLFIPNILSH